MVDNSIRRTIIVQALYTTAQNDLEGYMKIKTRLLRKVSDRLQISGIADGLEYCTILPFLAKKTSEAAELKKSVEITDFIDTVYNERGRWTAKNKMINPDNILLYKNLSKAINDNSSDLLEDRSSAKNLIDLLERRNIHFGDEHVSSGFPSNYLDQLMKLYDSKREHGIILTKAKGYHVQFTEKVIQRKREPFFVNNFGFDGVLDSAISIAPIGYGRRVYLR